METENQQIKRGMDINPKIKDFLSKKIYRTTFSERHSVGEQKSLEYIRDDNQKLVQVNTLRYDIHHGRSQTWYFEGYKDSMILIEKERANFAKGKRDGLHLEWYPNGQLKSRMIFKDDKLDDIFQIWHSNGQLKERRYYVDCKLHGCHEKWYDDGQDKSRKNYVMGKLQ